MISIMRDITAIGKDSKNQTQGFSFRGIDAVYNELHNLLAKHGVITLPQAGTPIIEERTNSKGTVLRFVTIPMVYTFIAEDGSFVTCQVLGEGMDSGDKATNKAMAIAHKYALLQTFLIPTAEMKDPDYESHDVRPVTRAVIAKPVIKTGNSLDTLFGLMDTNKVSEEEVRAFCLSKGMKDVPEFVADINEPVAKRLVEIFSEVIEFSLNK